MSSVVQAARPGLDRKLFSIGEPPILGAICVATVAGLAIVLAGASANARETVLPVFLFGAGVIFGSSLSDLARAREVRFARALTVTGLLWAFSALIATDQAWLVSIGHVAQWATVLAIVYLLLSYPSGRLGGRVDRALFGGGTLLLGLMYLPTLLVTPQFSHPSLWSACTAGCPANALSITQSTPAFVHDFVIPARETLTGLLFVAVAAALLYRERKAGPLLGRFYAPIAAIAVSEAVVMIAFFLARAVSAGSTAGTALGWIFVASLPAITLARGVGRLYRRIYAADALDRIAHSVKPGTGSARIRQDLAEAIADPSLHILESVPGMSAEWIDESGTRVTGGVHPGDRITEIADGARRIAIVHDPALADEPFIVHIAGSFALAALENDRLSEELEASRKELADSRKRRLMAQLNERQKIEQDLHDGAQQRLLALRVKLEMAATKLEIQDPAQAKALRALGKEVDMTIDEVRAFARGIYPAVLVRSGLAQSLRTVSRDSPLPTSVHARGLGRYSPELEATVYLSCSEALQNACKHASAATAVAITVWDDGQLLRFIVHDDGAAFDVTAVEYGSGLTNLNDRLTALGGTMTIQSIRGRGTVLVGSIPVPQV